MDWTQKVTERNDSMIIFRILDKNWWMLISIIGIEKTEVEEDLREKR